MKSAYYGWVMVLLASLAMVGTMPGRTNFLGMISKALVDDPAFQLTDSRLTQLNFWAVILGSALALPIGWFIDRIGVRLVLTTVALALAAVTYTLSQLTTDYYLLLVLILLRGLGQGALSVVALTMIGKWFTRRINWAMAIFSVLITFGFVGGAVWLIESVKDFGWRKPWEQLSYMLAGLAILGLLLARNQPVDDREAVQSDGNLRADVPWREALVSRAFWVFSLGGAVFLFSFSAITLLPEQLLLARGFSQESMKETLELFLGILTFIGLPANLLGGWLARVMPLGRLLSISLLALAISLAIFPFVTTLSLAVAYAVLLGFSGGLVTVVYFAAYGANFGRGQLGFIQAFAQVLTVLASALGPVVLTETQAAFHSDRLYFWISAAVTLLLALAAWGTRHHSKAPTA